MEKEKRRETMDENGDQETTFDYSLIFNFLS